MKLKLTQASRAEDKYPELNPLWIAVFVDILGFSVIIPLLPFLTEAWDVSAFQLGFLLSVNSIFGFVFGPIWGKLSDVVGRKPILLVCQGGTLAAFLLVAFSDSYKLLILARIVDGVFGGNFPVAKAIIGDVIPPHRRSVFMSNIGVAHILSSVIGPGIGGLMADTGLFGLGLMASALTVLTITLTYLKVEESNPVVLKRRELEKNTKKDPVSRKKTVKSALKEIFQRKKSGILKNNPIALFLLVQWGFHTLSFFIYISTITLFANVKLSLTAQRMGLLLFISGIIRLIVRFVIFVPLIEHLGERKTSILGLTIFAVVFFFMGSVRSPVHLAIILVFVSFAAGCTRGVLTGYLSRAVNKKHQGIAMGYNASLDSVAQIIGPLLGGAILDTGKLFWYGGSAGIFASMALFMSFRDVEPQLKENEERE